MHVWQNTVSHEAFISAQVKRQSSYLKHVVVDSVVVVLMVDREVEENVLDLVLWVIDDRVIEVEVKVVLPVKVDPVVADDVVVFVVV